MQLYDTRRQSVAPFEAGDDVTIYTCGITPYDAAHVGHAAMMLAYDVLQLRLRDAGHTTRLVRNITDVDDSILAKATEIGEDWKALGDRETEYFQKNVLALNLIPAHAEPRATDAINEIITLVQRLVDAGHGYEAGGSVYFDVSTWERFGEISHLSEKEMLAFATERGGRPEDSNKRQPLDFVLWQKFEEGEPSWDSPWGPGRPGWHIECSALAMKELGDTIDLHGGGGDLIFPHHECEEAQSRALTGAPLARHWMHVAMVRLGGEKMSKSLGNLIFVGDLLKDWDYRAVRLAISAHHYRVEWEWADSMMPAAAARLEHWIAAGEGDGALEEVRAALDDDLDTPTAVELIDQAAAKGHGVSRAAALLGIQI